MEEGIRAKVLNAALDIAGSGSASKITYAELSKRTGVSKGGITHHFPNKDVLLSALAQKVLDDFNKEFLVHSEGDAPGGVRLVGGRYVSKAFFELEAQRDRAPAMAVLAIAAHDPNLLKPIADYFKTRTEEVMKTSRNPEKVLAAVLAVEGLWMFGSLGIPQIEGSLKETVGKALMDWVDVAE